ncbi:MAG: class I SAM-dependent methyltransferase [Pirellulaceae bacterium]|nr:class I SAM-dependent methyltransferase [Pirellulaceae bacterium]
MTLNLEVAEWLTQWCQSPVGQQVLRESPTGRAALAGVVRLRKSGLSLEQASAVVELLELRHRAAAKFERANELYFTRRAYEQASGQATTRWKIATLKKNWPAQPLVMLDLCCGIGGDFLEFSRHFPTIGLDRDAALVHLTRENLQVLGSHSELRPNLVVCADVTSVLPSDSVASSDKSTTSGVIARRPPRVLGDWLPYLPAAVSVWAKTNQLLGHVVVWHLDPDRRDAKGRHTSMADLSPDEAFLRALLQWSSAGMVKLAPATELTDLWRAVGHWQWLGVDRECKQLLGWFGCEPLLTAGLSSVAVAQRDELDWSQWQPAPGIASSVARSGEPLRYLYEPHPAIFAARLNHQFAAERDWFVLTGCGYYTSSQLAEQFGELFTGFQVLEVLPLRTEKIREWLARHERSLVEIKSRTVVEKDWKPLAGLLGHSVGSARAAGVSGLLFRQDKLGGQALRVAMCERVVKRT